ncbi:hypothetical protein HDU98_006223 [Podochytrium sp. JEL0797]|nr:hypothetical protein HDU98_006223 [Podochytrium sp. JEL0797]
MYSLEDIDKLLGGFEYINTVAPPPQQQQQQQQQQLQIPFSSLLHATQNPPMLTPLSSKGNSPSARLAAAQIQQLANEQNQPITHQGYSESFFNYNKHSNSVGACDNANGGGNGGMFHAAEMPMGYYDAWGNYIHMPMMSKPHHEHKGPNATEAAAGYFQIDPSAGGTSQTNNFHAQLQNCHMQFPNKSTRTLTSSTDISLEDSCTFSQETLLNAASHVPGTSSTSASSSTVSPFQSNDLKQPPLPPQHTYIPMSQLQYFQNEHSFSPVASHTPLVGVPLYTSSQHSTQPNTIHFDQTPVPKRQMMSYPTVQPSAIYYQPSYTTAPASQPETTRFQPYAKPNLAIKVAKYGSGGSSGTAVGSKSGSKSGSSRSSLSPNDSSFSDSASSSLLSSERKHAAADDIYQTFMHTVKKEPSLSVSPTVDVATAVGGGVVVVFGSKKRGPKKAAGRGAGKKTKEEKEAAVIRKRNAKAELSLVSPVDEDGEDSDEYPSKKSKKAMLSKRRPNHKPDITARLFKWLMEHQHEPYPNEEQKKAMSADTGLTLNQINDWFINARRRYLKNN